MKSDVIRFISLDPRLVAWVDAQAAAKKQDAGVFVNDLVSRAKAKARGVKSKAAKSKKAR